MSGYTKLFSSIITSTIWREPPVVCKVWITMLALADRDGVIEASVPGLADLCRVTIEETEAALQKFLSPDQYSRSPEHDGRRIEPMDGGWRLVNFDKYQLKLSPDDIREKAAIRSQRYRDKRGVTQKHDASVTQRDERDESRKSRHADADADADADLKPSTEAVASACEPAPKLGEQDQDDERPSTAPPAEREAPPLVLEPDPTAGGPDQPKEKRAGRADTADPRHAPFMEDVFTYYRRVNDGRDPPFVALAGKQLSLMLKNDRQMDRDLFRRCLANRGLSDVVHADPPHKWICDVVRYANGSLDKFNKPSNGGKNGISKGEQRYQQNINDLRVIVDKARTDRLAVTEIGDDAGDVSFGQP